MLNSLYQMSDVYLLILFATVAILGSTIPLLLVRHHVSHDLRNQHNDVIGNVSASIGLIYGVLVGLTALYLFNNNSYTADAVQREANAAANIYRDSQWLNQPTQIFFRNQIQNYLTQVVDNEWPAMGSGRDVSTTNGALIEQINTKLKNYKVTTQSEQLIMGNMITSLKNLYDSRQERISMSHRQLSPEIWMVIIIGSCLTISINFLFGMNFYLHVLTVCAIALMSFAMIFLLVTLDRPFQGEFSIDSEPLKKVLSEIKSTKMV